MFMAAAEHLQPAGLRAGCPRVTRAFNESLRGSKVCKAAARLPHPIFKYSETIGAFRKEDWESSRIPNNRKAFACSGCA
jgi:hypothetical protein